MLYDDIYNIIAENVTSFDVITNMRLSNKVLFNSTQYVREISNVNLKLLFNKNGEPLFSRLRKIEVIFNENENIKILFALLKKLINGKLMVIKVNLTFDFYNKVSVKNFSLLPLLSTIIYDIKLLSVYCTRRKYNSRVYKEAGLYKLIRNNNDNVKITLWDKIGFPSIEYLVKHSRNEQNNFSLRLNNKLPKYLHTIKSANIVSIIVDYKFSNIETLSNYLRILNHITTLEVTKDGIICFCKYITSYDYPYKIDQITKILIPLNLKDFCLKQKTIYSIKTIFPNSTLEFF